MVVKIKLNHPFFLHFLKQISVSILLTMTDDGIFTYQQISIASNFLMKLAFQNAYKEYHNQELQKKKRVILKKCMFIHNLLQLQQRICGLAGFLVFLLNQNVMRINLFLFLSNFSTNL